VSSPVPTPHTGSSSFSNKTSWRSRTARSVDLPVYEPDVPVADAPADDAPADEPAVGVEEELVLEQDADDGDYTGLTETVIEPEER
jgi:hypothetical protein